MNRNLRSVAGIVLGGGALVAAVSGCTNTVAGAREDIRYNGEKINRQLHPERYPPPPPSYPPPHYHGDPYSDPYYPG